jgi:multiple sugar transport system permease protein
VLVPSALGLASASLLFYAIYSPQSSPLNPALRALGVIDEPISFLGTSVSALWSTVFLIVWRFAGFYMLLLMVGLQGISADVYEAARMDGANRRQVFTRITLPLLRPSLALCTILCVTGSLLAFDQFFILTKGGPDNSTVTIVQLIYNMAFAGQNDLGVAAALSVMVLGALLLLNVAQFRGLRGKED